MTVQIFCMVFLIFLVTKGTFSRLFGHWAIHILRLTPCPSLPSKRGSRKTEMQTLGALKQEQLYSKIYVIFCCSHNWSHLNKTVITDDSFSISHHVTTKAHSKCIWIFNILLSFIFTSIQNLWANSFSE